MPLSLDDLKKAKDAKKGAQQSTGLAKTNAQSSLDSLKKKIGSGTLGLTDQLNNLSASVLPQVSLELQKAKSVRVVFLFDRSGSVEGTEEVTKNSYNKLIQSEKRSGFKTEVTTILFSHEEKVLCNKLPIDQVPMMQSYYADGGTALYDTLCSHILSFEEEDKQKRSNYDRTLFVIMTDGKDESSTKYDLHDTRKLVLEARKKGWEFVYLGAMNYAKDMAEAIGIKRENAEVYCLDGITYSFEAAQKVLTDLHESGKISPDWSKAITSHRPALTSGDDTPKQYRLGGK